MFVGSLDSGSNMTIDSEITPEKSGTLAVQVVIEYQDTFNKAQTIAQALSINVEGTTTKTNPRCRRPVNKMQMRQAPAPAYRTLPTQTEESGIWQIVLRFIRGMIGFDSSAPANTGNRQRSLTTPTPTP